MDPVPTIIITVNGRPLVWWKSYRISLDLLTPADGFEAELSPALPADVAAVQTPAMFTMTAGPTPIMTGPIDEAEAAASKQEKSIYMSGRDKGGLLLDSNPDARLSVANKTVTQVAEQLCAPMGMTVIAGPEANIPIKAVNAGPTDKIWDILSRLAKNVECMLFTDGLGNLHIEKIVANPTPEFAFNYYEVPPLNKSNNVESIAVTWNHSERPSTIIVTAQAPIKKKGKTMLKKGYVAIRGAATDPEMIAAGIVRTAIIADDNVRTVAAANSRAKQQLALSRLQGTKCRVAVAGHTQGGKLYRVGATGSVTSEFHGITAKPMIIVAVDFFKSKDNRGTGADITLCEPEALQ